MKPHCYNPFIHRICGVSAATVIALHYTPQNAAAASAYWDIDGTTAGAGGASPGGNWNDTNWSASADGDAATAPWTAGDTAVFSAGTDAIGAFTVNLASATTIGGLDVGEGTPTIAGSGSLILGSATTNLNISAGTGVIINSAISGGSNNLVKNGDGALTLGGGASLSGNFIINGGDVTINSTVGNIDKISFQWNYTTNQNLNIQTGANITANRFVMTDLYYSESTVSHSGGTLNVVGNNDTNTTSASFLLGHWGYGSTCVYGLSGGTLNSLSARLSLGWDRSNVQVNQTGGTANLLGINLNNGRGNTASYNLSGGRLNLGSGGINNQANKTINIGAAVLGAFANWESTKSITLTGAGNLTVDTLDSSNGTTARNITLSGGITESASAGIIKNGIGTLSVSGSVSYTGDTVINGGKFLPGAMLATSKLVVNASGSLGTGTLSTPGTSVVGDVDLNGGNLSIRVGTTSDKLDALTVNVNNPSTIEMVPTQPVNINDEFVVLKYETLGGLGFSGLSPALQHYTTALIDDSANSQVKIKVTGVDSLIWTGSASSVWDVNNTLNWKLVSALPATVPTKFYDADVITFDDTSSVGSITLTGDIKPSAVTVNNNVTNYSFSGGSINGAASLTKSGTASLDLSGSHGFTGPVDIQGGRVITSTAASLGGGTTAVKLGAGSVLQATSSYTLPRLIQLTGGAASLETDTGTTLTLASAFNGGGTLTKSGAGTMKVQGYGGGTFGGTSVVVNSGTLEMAGGAFNANIGMPSITLNAGTNLVIPSGSFHALGGAFTTSPVINLVDATFTIGQEQYLDAINMTGGEILAGGANPEIRTDYNFHLHTLPSADSSVIGSGVSIRKVNSNLLFTVDDGAAAEDLVFNGNFGTTSTLMTKAGGGTMVIGSTVSYTDTVISAGTLQIGNGGTTGNVGSGTVTNNGTLVFKRSDLVLVSGVISGTGSVIQNGTGSLGLDGTNTYTGDTIVNSGTLEISGSSIADTGKLAINGSGVVDVFSNEDVQSLYIDGVAQPTGTYGSSGSGATHIDDTHFTGSGFVNVTGAGYTSWVGGFGLALADQDPGDDPDKDGVTNALEWVLGGNPAAVMDAAKLPAVSTSGGNLVFTFKRDQDSKVAGTSVAIEVGTTLAAWPSVYNVGNTTGTSSAGVTVTDNLDGTDTVTLTITRAPDAAKFARLRVGID